MSRLLTALESFLTLSEAMANAATTQEWEELTSLGGKRDVLSAGLPSDLSTQLPSAEQSRARTIIERCQLLDQQTRTCVKERQKELRVVLREPSPV